MDSHKLSDTAPQAQRMGMGRGYLSIAAPGCHELPPSPNTLVLARTAGVWNLLIA